MIKSPEQYLEVIATGRLDPIVQFSLSQRMNLEMENERLMNGEYVPVAVTDDHPLHIQEHVVLINDPMTRQDPTISDTVLAHIQSHLNIWKGADPALLAALGLPPAPIPAPPLLGPGMGAEGSAGAQGSPPTNGSGDGGGVAPGSAPAQSMPSSPEAPAIPMPAA